MMRGDLLALVEAAPGPLRTIEAALNRWVDLRLAAAVHEHVARFSGLGGDGAVPQPAAEKGDDAADPTEAGSAVPDESLAYVLVALPTVGGWWGAATSPSATATSARSAHGSDR